jgi:hypothetical protein
MKAARNYKALYHECAKQSAAKDRLITLQHEQVTQLANEQRTSQRIMATQALEIKQLQQLHTQQQQTILGQAEKLSQLQTIVAEQNTTIASQQNQLVKNKKEILRLDNLRYELITLKKWIYGIKSEKRHQPEKQSDAVRGDHLSLLMDVDSWGICKVNSRRKIQEHLRVIKTTEPKKRGGRHDFPEGLEE